MTFVLLIILAILVLALSLRIKTLKIDREVSNSLIEGLQEKIHSSNSVVNLIQDKSYIISNYNTNVKCKRCEVKGLEGVIHENKRLRFRVNESKVWVNSLPSFFYCTKCKFKSLTLKRLTRISEDKIK